MNQKIMFKSAVWILYSAFFSIQAQVYVSKSSVVHFFSETPMENIEATSNQTSSVLNTQTGELVISINISSFRFASKLMEEHFNENYMESDKYPKADFKGKIVDLKSVNFEKDGVYNVEVSGDLTIHGVKKPRKINAQLVVKSGSIIGTSKFKVALVDHNIERPKIV
ncbi:MAG TPA: YceI family protein, partial [Cytophagales bacterium]|nr:YceI family protein [Cytophagales bacterium]